jgi:hypothetical protein
MVLKSLMRGVFLMIRIIRDESPFDENVMELDAKEMSIIWSSLEFLTQVQDPEDRPKHEREELQKKLIPFFNLKDKIKKHLVDCGKEGIWNEDIY